VFEDARSLPDGHVLTCDVAIVGTGAGGATLAAELIGSGLDVVVLEAGGFAYDKQTQGLYSGEVDDARHAALDAYRRRMFGGTTTVWGGRCAPFDAIDFETRSYVPHSGWPITREDVEPHYRRAHRYTHTGEFDYTVAGTLPRASASLIAGFASDVVLQDQLWRFSLPTDFGRTNRDALDKAVNVRVLLWANCLRILTNADGSAVTGVVAATLQGKRCSVNAARVVLAAGGLETVRLLLLSDDVKENGLGNDHDLVGRFYASHITGDLGEVTFVPRERRIVWGYERDRDGVYCKRNLRVEETNQRQLGLSNARLILSHPPFSDPSHGSGVLSAGYLAKAVMSHRISPEFSRALGMTGYEHVGRHLANIVMDLPSVLAFGGRWAVRRLLAERKLPSVSVPSRSNTYTLHYDAEQVPDRESRVELGDERDPLGLRRLTVRWRPSAQDFDSAVRTWSVLRDELERSGVASVTATEEDVRASLAESGVGSHHCGTTRMSSSPSTGVVDENCMVHSVRNLYVAGPSVFPTPGYANPVLTTTMLAVRLADHLKTRR
jgi:choline dehydrogenase-like flavoprotein